MSNIDLKAEVNISTYRNLNVVIGNTKSTGGKFHEAVGKHIKIIFKFTVKLRIRKCI